MNTYNLSNEHQYHYEISIPFRRCLFKDYRMWTLVYKITGASTLKNTRASNVDALGQPLNSDKTGKLSDTSIRELCNGQYLMKQENTEDEYFGGMLYCHFDDISKYGDGKRSSKRCSSSFNIDPAKYWISVDAQDYAYGFSSREKTDGGIIVQANYHNGGYKGSTMQNGASGSNRFCTSRGGCKTTVWCISSTLESAMPRPFQRYDKDVKTCRFCAGPLDANGKVCQ